ncbi:MAG: Na(+)/H(+) antiporter subunit D [Ectothiorhodospiraceae bacterium]|nr:Na(+)/H(+) antiporter subunit D [Chromatiales bacterium]MCP5157206.1 Na(+)/H(+) antiporter subunit D [Ectothiorhodospiraceae bacterium]
MVPPFVPFLIAALLVPALQGRARSVLVLVAPIVGALTLVGAPEGVAWQLDMLGLTLEPVRVDRLSLIFGYIFHIAAFVGGIYAWHLRDSVQASAGLLYAGSAIGAVFAGDLLTLFVFWEVMAVSSVFLIWARGTPEAIRSAQRYLVVQITSGVLLLAGALVHLEATGSIAFGHLGLDAPGGVLILLAFGIKCAFPGLHSWLTDAYPQATPTGTVFLSAFTTKAAVYTLARGYAGTELLVWIGATMAFFPIFYAVIENDLRRVLGYSLINQLGFMVTGIGIGTEMAVNGAAAHAFSHILYKALLFMSMGAVLHMTGRINGSDLGGLYRSMPRTTVLCIVGAASISAFPLFSGFISKPMVMTAALEQGYDWVWLVLLFASAGVFHHAGIKIPYFAFFAHDSGIRTTEPPVNMQIAMLVAATLCVGIGCFPELLYAHLPFATDYSPYDASHVLAQLQLLLFSALAFAWLTLSGLYPPELRSVNLDADWVYRRLGPRLVGSAREVIGTADAAVRSAAVGGLVRLGGWLARVYGPRAPAGAAWPTHRTVAITLVLLGGYILLQGG